MKLLCLALCALPAFAAGERPKKRSKPMTLELTSPAFKAKAPIPKKHTGEGEDVSPELSWSAAPKGTKSLALIMDDPDAPPGTWVHWVLYDLPADAAKLDQGVAKKETLPNGAKQGACWGVKEFDRVGYFGPLPPPGKPHRYFFKLFALDAALGLPPKATAAQVVKAMEGHVLAKGELMGTYKR